VEVFIRAIPLVVKQIKKVLFVVVGDGDQRKYLEDLAKKLNVIENVMFLVDCNI
jgi:glycosyltransferase involved in cell wall biosynthesis